MQKTSHTSNASLKDPNHSTYFPNLETERLILSPLTEQDTPQLFAWASHPDVIRAVTWKKHNSADESLNFIRRCSVDVNLGPDNVYVIWAIRDRHNKCALGSVSYRQTGDIEGEIEFVLGRDHWDHGFTREASEEVIDWIFEFFPQIQRIQGRCVSHNLGSRRVMEKIGMDFEGIHHALALIDGQPTDIAFYAITRKVWDLRQKDGSTGKTLESETPGSMC